MAKGYWIARIDIHNMDGYRAYITANAEVFHKYGANFIVRGGQCEAREGTSRSRNVVLEFKDYATALACYNSPEYQKLLQSARRIRTAISSSSKAMTARSLDRHCEA